MACKRLVEKGLVRVDDISSSHFRINPRHSRSFTIISDVVDYLSPKYLNIINFKLSLSDTWLMYEGETLAQPRLIVRKHLNRLNSKSLVYVSLAGSPLKFNNVGNNRDVIYEIERSYKHKCCVIYDDKRRCVAEIRRKEAKTGVSLGGDVFHLVVQPLIDRNVAMALVIVLDQMFGSSRHFLT
ncbi:tubby C-terminal-like domain-containing protein [Artemisia annua]|uniref:Tubby C-terminal-like domain-containing protein n=1 Tax=Artemisia annua TaxID=35608 RepID=A0A2U1N6N0_ARTAN|nr:tubby C-terminal-like domain-containing protein [Artemisia annua]